MKQQWAMFTMGVWIGGSILTAIVAAENFYTIDRLLAGSRSVAFTSVVERLGRPETRELLRYLSSELNRLYFQLWNVAELAVGILVLWLLGRNPRAAKARWGVVGMLCIIVLMTLWLTPQIVSVGRSLDFVPRDPPPPALRSFGILHALYSSLAAVIVVLGSIVAAWIAQIARPRNVSRAAA